MPSNELPPQQQPGQDPHAAGPDTVPQPPVASGDAGQTPPASLYDHYFQPPTVEQTPPPPTARSRAESIFGKRVVASMVDAGPLGVIADIQANRKEKKRIADREREHGPAKPHKRSPEEIHADFEAHYQGLVNARIEREKEMAAALAAQARQRQQRQEDREAQRSSPRDRRDPDQRHESSDQHGSPQGRRTTAQPNHHQTQPPRTPRATGQATPRPGSATDSSGRYGVSTPIVENIGPNPTTPPRTPAAPRTGTRPGQQGGGSVGERFVIDPTRPPKTPGGQGGSGERSGTQRVGGPAKQSGKPPRQEASSRPSGREKLGRRAEDTWEMTLMLLAGELSEGKQPPSTSPLSLASKYVEYFGLHKKDLKSGVPEAEAKKNAIGRVLHIAETYFTRLQSLGYVSKEYVKIDPNDPANDKRKTGYVVTAKKDSLEADIREHRRLRAERKRQGQ